jgi:hypothetical protein
MMGVAMANVPAIATLVIPAKAGIQAGNSGTIGPWIPAFAGMTAAKWRRGALV